MKSKAMKNIADEYEADFNKLVELAGLMRQRNNNALGTIYTQLEAVMGESKQCQALKDLIKWEVWRMTDENQNIMYSILKKNKGSWDDTLPKQ